MTTLEQVNSQLKAKSKATPAKAMSTPTPDLKLSIEAIQARVSAALAQSKTLYNAARSIKGASTLATAARALHIRLSDMQGDLAEAAAKVRKNF